MIGMKDGIRVKICGITSKEDLKYSIVAGADYLGFVFFNASPRNITLESARTLCNEVPDGIVKVAVTVNPNDYLIEAITRLSLLDMIQLHGNEDPHRINVIRDLTHLPIIKAVGIANSLDLRMLESYENVSDQLLIDAKAPKGSRLPGGNGIKFDWSLLKDYKFTNPWFLAGGLNSANVVEAIAETGAKQIDASSGLEDSPGKKNYQLIKNFVNTVKSAKKF